MSAFQKFVWVLGLTLASSTWAPTAGAAEKILKVVPAADLKVLDPITTTQGITQSHALMVYDTLFGTDENQVPQPQMVGNYSVSADGKSYSFTLRPGLKFHDGAAVTAADVIPSLKRWGAKDAEGKTLLGATEELTAVDDKTVRWRLNKPYGYVLAAIGKNTSNVPVIMPKRFAETDPDKAVTEVVGSGPFIFKKDEWVPGSKIVYVKNKDYMPRSEPASGSAGGKVVKVDRVEWVIISDAQTAVNALINGEVDFYESPSADFLPALKAKGIVTTPTNKIGFQGMLRVNHVQPPFNNPKMRQAMLKVVNQETYMKAMFGDPSLYKICGSYFGCGTLTETTVGADALLKPDSREARRLFQEAGYKGEKIVILHPTDVKIMNDATLVTAQLMRDAGLNVELQAMDWATIGTRRNNKGTPAEGGWNIMHTWWNAIDVSNPLRNNPLFASCDKAWPGWPCDKAHQDLIDAFEVARTVDEKKDLAKKIQESALKLVPYIPFGQWQSPVAYRPTISGVVPVPGVIIYWNIDKAG